MICDSSQEDWVQMPMPQGILKEPKRPRDWYSQFACGISNDVPHFPVADFASGITRSVQSLQAAVVCKSKRPFGQNGISTSDAFNEGAEPEIFYDARDDLPLIGTGPLSTWEQEVQNALAKRNTAAPLTQAEYEVNEKEVDCEGRDSASDEHSHKENSEPIPAERGRLRSRSRSFSRNHKSIPQRRNRSKSASRTPGDSHERGPIENRRSRSRSRGPKNGGRTQRNDHKSPMRRENVKPTTAEERRPRSRSRSRSRKVLNDTEIISQKQTIPVERGRSRSKARDGTREPSKKPSEQTSAGSEKSRDRAQPMGTQKKPTKPQILSTPEKTGVVAKTIPVVRGRSRGRSRSPSKKRREGNALNAGEQFNSKNLHETSSKDFRTKNESPSPKASPVPEKLQNYILNQKHHKPMESIDAETLHKKVEETKSEDASAKDETDQSKIEEGIEMVPFVSQDGSPGLMIVDAGEFVPSKSHKMTVSNDLQPKRTGKRTRGRSAERHGRPPMAPLTKSQNTTAPIYYLNGRRKWPARKEKTEAKTNKPQEAKKSSTLQNDKRTKHKLKNTLNASRSSNETEEAPALANVDVAALGEVIDAVTKFRGTAAKLGISEKDLLDAVSTATDPRLGLEPPHMSSSSVSSLTNHSALF